MTTRERDGMMISERHICCAARRLGVAALTMATAGCLPYPMESPVVRPGVSVGAVTGLRAILHDTTGGNRSGMNPSVIPEAAVAASLGFARADGTGPAFRAGGAFGVPGPWEWDLYAQLPRAGPVVGGLGAVFALIGSSDDRRATQPLPYATIGWRPSDHSIFYGSMTLTTSHRRIPPDTTIHTQAIVLGYEDTHALLDGQGSTSARCFIAIFRGDPALENISGFDAAKAPLRSLFVAGVSVDATRSWQWFNRRLPDPGRRRPPRRDP